MDLATYDFLNNAYKALTEAEPRTATGYFDEEHKVELLPYSFEDFSTSPIAEAFVKAFTQHRTWLNEPAEEANIG